MNASKRSNIRAKTHICPNDGKRFATKRALEQHACSAHAAPKALGGARGRRGRSRNGGPLSSDIAPSRIPPPPGGSLTISGEDRILSRDVRAGQAVLQSLSLDVSMSGRLNTISRAYQRVRWDMIEVYVTPQASATTNGGYVCGFIMDPTDNHVTADVLSASQGSQTKKWYETAVVRMPRKTDLLYTSDSVEPRLSEPARFWIISEGKPSSDLNIIVTCKWRVTLSGPTLEDKTSDSFVLVGDLRSHKDNYDMEYFPHCSTTSTSDFSSQIPARLKEIAGNHFFRVPTFSVEYVGEASEILSDQMHYVVYKVSDKKAYYSSDGSTINTSKWAAAAEQQYLVPEGTFFKYVGQGNVCAAAVQGPRRSVLKASEPFSDRLTRVEGLLSELRSSLGQNSRTLRRTLTDSEMVFVERPTQSGSSP